MNAAQHRAKSETLLAKAAEVISNSTPGTRDECEKYSAHLLAAAQVHATLAVADSLRATARRFDAWAAQS